MIRPVVACRTTKLLPLLAGLVLSCTAAGAGAAPSTFGPVIGSALLCRSQLDNAYFHAYLTESFGPAYKREGGAYWFRTEASLWGSKVEQVMVSDDTSAVVFVAAILEAKPDELEKSVRAAGFDRHLLKPALPDDVEAVLAAATTAAAAARAPA